MKRAVGFVVATLLTGGAASNQTEGPEVDQKPACEKCEKSLAAGDEAYHCSYNCKFCPDCTKAMNHVCPNCGGALS